MSFSISGESLWLQLVAAAETEITEVLNTLPPHVRDRATEVPITLEPKPSAAMAAGGIHPEHTLGLFTGVPYLRAIAVSQRLPPQIILFLENLWTYARHDPAEFRIQVRQTLLHEIGHYLGWDEHEVGQRGL